MGVFLVLWETQYRERKVYYNIFFLGGGGGDETKVTFPHNVRHYYITMPQPQVKLSTTGQYLHYDFMQIHLDLPLDYHVQVSFTY